MHTSDCRTNYYITQSPSSMLRTKEKQTCATHNAKNLPLRLEESEEDNKRSSLDSCLRLPLFLVFCNVNSAACFMMIWNVLRFMADVNWMKQQTQHQQVQNENMPGDTTLDFLLNSYLCSSHLFVKKYAYHNQTITPMLKLNRWPSTSSQNENTIFLLTPPHHPHLPFITAIT